MGIAPKSRTILDGVGNPAAFASAHGLDATRTITLDVEAFTAATHYPKGVIRNCTPVGKITASGLYGPYDNAAEDGTETLAGFVVGDYSVDGQDRLQVALLDHGKIRESELPIPVDAAGKADVAGRIQFV